VQDPLVHSPADLARSGVGWDALQRAVADGRIWKGAPGVCLVRDLVMLRQVMRCLPESEALEVDGVLLVEIDGRTYHSDVSDFEEDRRRGNAASRNRRYVLRIPARWVLADPQSAVREVAAWFRGGPS
jgi:hypothetical protein